MAGQYEGGPVLLAEDEPETLNGIRDALRAEDLLVIGCRTVRSATEAAEFHRPSVVVVDVAMEGGRGWELLHAEAARAGTRTLALDRRGDELVRRAAFAAGADDVASPPLAPSEIAARVRSLHKRDRIDAGGPVLRHGDLVIDVPAHQVRVGGRPIPVTAQQFAILRALCEARGATLHRSQLLARIAALEDEPPSDRAVDLHISRLRRRLGTSGRGYIEAIYGVGYRLIRPGAPPGLPAEAAAAALDAIGSAVLLIDDELRIRGANRAAQRLLGPGDIVGRPCAEVLRCRTADGVQMTGPMCLGRAVLSGGGPITHVRAVVRAEGSPTEVDLSHTPVTVDGASRLVAIEVMSQCR